MTSYLVSCPDCGHRFPVDRDTMRAEKPNVVERVRWTLVDGKAESVETLRPEAHFYGPEDAA